MRRPLLLGAALALLAVAAPADAQEESPEVLAQRALAIAEAHDWEGMARLIDPAELERVQRTFALLMEAEPDPNVLAMFDVASADEFRKLPPHDVMMSFLEIAEVQQQLASVQILDGRVIGIVREGDDQAHAVVRQTVRVQEIEVASVDIISMRRRDGMWWLQMGPELEGMLVGLEAGLAEAGY